MKRLPIGMQTFEEIRSKDYLYVDKTKIIYDMVSDKKIYFLSRPRRFGKSLLISTLDSLFEGCKELFEGLYIYDRWDWSIQYPVIRIDWTKINPSTFEQMNHSICKQLRDIAKQYQVTLEEDNAIDCFTELINLLYYKTNKTKVVILIDEYDNPITDHLFDSNLDDFRKAVHNFYRVMKGSDEYIHFIFITGVSKFSGLSIFSALNNPTDITLKEKYASICGYTQEELESNFSEYIDRAAESLSMTRDTVLKRIRYWYNGYTWDGKTAIYNPFSTMNFFDDKVFSDYWFATGTPTFLTEIIQRRNNPNMVLESITVSAAAFKEYDPTKISEIPLLFQTGYLTIKQKEVIDGIPSYTLGVPNMEVNEAFMKSLLEAYGKYSQMDIDNLRKTMETQIIAGDEDSFTQSLESMIATVPYEIHKPGEAYYHAMILIWMRLIGFKIHGEVSNLGRADAVWEQSNVTVVAEIKYHAKKKINTLLNDAMKQIYDRRYYNRYIGKVILLGIAFSGTKVGCRMKTINN
jgi:hypothetical protein